MAQYVMDYGEPDPMEVEVHQYPGPQYQHYEMTPTVCYQSPPPHTVVTRSGEGKGFEDLGSTNKVIVVVAICVAIGAIIGVAVYFGATSKLALCDTDPCVNGGTCMANGYEYYCSCPEFFMGGECQYGLRLDGGSARSNGNIQLFSNLYGEWTGISSDSDYWDTYTVNLVCRNLGYTEGLSSTAYQTADTVTKILFEDPICTGHESFIHECSFDGTRTTTSSQAGAICL